MTVEVPDQWDPATAGFFHRRKARSRYNPKRTQPGPFVASRLWCVMSERVEAEAADQLPSAEATAEATSNELPVLSIWNVRSWYMFGDPERIDYFKGEGQWRRTSWYGSGYPKTPQEVDGEILADLKSGVLKAFSKEAVIEAGRWTGILSIKGHFDPIEPYFDRANVIAARPGPPLFQPQLEDLLSNNDQNVAAIVKRLRATEGPHQRNLRKMVLEEVELHLAKRTNGAEKDSAEQQVKRYFELEEALAAGRTHFPKGYRAPFDAAAFERKLLSAGTSLRAIKYITPRIKAFVKRQAIESALKVN
jgi:hypothetical protein